MMTRHSSTYVLATLPNSLHQSPTYITPRQKWRQSFNVAAWLRYQEPTHETCQLFLRVEDSNGIRDIPVDRTDIISTVVLLSSKVTLNLTGSILSMSVILNSSTPLLWTDELFVQPVKGSANRDKAVGLVSTPSRSVPS